MGGRFAELIARQLDLFEQQVAEFLRRLDDAERAYDNAEREEAEEIYGRYQELVEHGTEALGEMRDTYSRTLDADDAEDYVAEFNQTVIDRMPRFGLEIEDV